MFIFLLSLQSFLPLLDPNKHVREKQHLLCRSWWKLRGATGESQREVRKQEREVKKQERERHMLTERERGAKGERGGDSGRARAGRGSSRQCRASEPVWRTCVWRRGGHVELSGDDTASLVIIADFEIFKHGTEYDFSRRWSSHGLEV